MPHLYPLTKEKFMELHREAWENGWTYGPGFDELYDDYLINWVYFVDYLDLLINTCVDNKRPRQYVRSASDVVTMCFDDGQVENIHVPDNYGIFFTNANNPVQKVHLNILIGEAPPFWKGSSNNSDRTYFYNPTHTNSSDWLEVPLKIFVYKATKKLTGTELKLNKLKYLSQKSCVLIDIFPFPIIQDTEIRKKITGEFSSFLEKHFVKKYKNVLEYVYDKKFEKILKESEPKRKHAIAMPLYGSLQITFGPNSRKVMDDLGIFQKGICLKDSLSDVKWKLKDNGRQTFNVIIIKKNKKKETDRYEFIKKLLEIGSIKEEFIYDWLECKTPEIPLLCSENGGLSHDKFLNSVKKNS
jgi:hypothetical protein